MIAHRTTAYARIKMLEDTPAGLLVTAENGPTKLQFIVNDPIAKRELTIGKAVSAEFDIADAR